MLTSAENVDLPSNPITAARMLYSRQKRKEIENAIRAFRPDVIHLHNAYPSIGPSVHLSAQEHGIPVVQTVHNFRMRCPNGLMFTEGSVCRRCQQGAYINAVVHRCFPTRGQASAYASILWLHRFALRLEDKVSAFIAPSAFMRDRVLSWGVDAQLIYTVPHFVQAHRGTDSSRVTSNTFGLFLGRLSSEKGVGVLLQALARAGDPPFKIVGDGPLRVFLEERATELGLTNTSFTGWRPHDEGLQLLSAARYLVAPSLSEEVAPLAAFEALAAGCPIIVSDRGALPELAVPGGGTVCRAGDPIELSEAIVRFAHDDVLCKQASSAGIDFARRSLSRERHLSQLEEVYGAVALPSDA